MNLKFISKFTQSVNAKSKRAFTFSARKNTLVKSVLNARLLLSARKNKFEEF